jgi:hypothetical protein
MFVDTMLDVNLAFTASGGAAYTIMPFRGKVRAVRGVLNNATSSATTNLTITAPNHGSGITMGVLAFAKSGGCIATSVGTWTANASTGTSMLSASSILKLDIPNASVAAAGTAQIQIDIDPYGAG